MDENEEFEFRLRMEKEQPSSAARIFTPTVAAGETTLSLGTGMAGAVAGGLAGLGTAAGNILGFTEKQPGDVVRNVAGAMTYQPRTPEGRAVTGAVAAPFEWLAGKADQAGAAVTDATGSPVAGTAVNTAIQALPMAIGPAARVAGLGKSSAAKAFARAKEEALNAKRDAGLTVANKEGLRVPPSQADSGWIMRLIEGLAGEPKTAKLASQKNAPILNSLIRRDVGLPDDVPISRQALADIRKTEGAAYDKVKQVGQVAPDAKYFDDFAKITKSYDQSAKDFAHRSENPFKKTLDGLTKDKDGNPKAGFDAASLVEEVKLLRSDADKAYRQGDPGLGKAFKTAAQAMDDMLERHIQQLAANDPQMAGLVSDYQAARVRIAKTYAADKALNDATGNINAAVYAKAFKEGRPLTGEAAKVGRFAEQFPRSAQRTEKLGSTGPTIFDIGMAALGREALLMGARPLARQAVTAFPPSIPTYGPNALARLLSDPAFGRVVDAAPIVGVGQSRRLQDIMEPK